MDTAPFRPGTVPAILPHLLSTSTRISRARACIPVSAQATAIVVSPAPLVCVETHIQNEGLELTTLPCRVRLRGVSAGLPSLIGALIGFPVGGVFGWTVHMATRKAIRDKYNIPGSCGEDCLTAACCESCAIVQVGLFHLHFCATFFRLCREEGSGTSCQADKSAASDGGDDQGDQEALYMGPRENRSRQFWKPSPVRPALLSARLTRQRNCG